MYLDEVHQKDEMKEFSVLVPPMVTPLAAPNKLDVVSAKKMVGHLGSTNTDMVIAGAKIPRPGETVSGGRFLMIPGGWDA